MLTEAKRFFEYRGDKEPDPNKIDTFVRLCDPFYLPSLDEVTDAFTFRRPAGSSSPTPMTDWKMFLYGPLPYSIYECFTREHIGRLSDYLSKKVTELGAAGNFPITILDTCAGNGRLPYFLKQGLNELIDQEKYRLIAVDNGSWEYMDPQEPIYDVEKMDYRLAVQEFQPDIVVASWIPSSFAYERNGSRAEKPSDWLTFFRQSASIAEHVIIGRPYWEDYYRNELEKPANYVPGYIRDGFTRIEHVDWAKFQLCSEDDGYHQRGSSVSTTVSFIRRNS